MCHFGVSFGVSVTFGVTFGVSGWHLGSLGDILGSLLGSLGDIFGVSGVLWGAIGPNGAVLLQAGLRLRQQPAAVPRYGTMGRCGAMWGAMGSL